MADAIRLVGRLGRYARHDDGKGADMTMNAEQRHREAAGPIMRWLYCDHGAEQERIFTEQMNEGDNDDHFVVQAFVKFDAERTARIDALEREVERLKAEPWPKWAEQIFDMLTSYGMTYDAEEGVDLGQCVADWLSDFDPADHARAAEQTVAAAVEVLEQIRDHRERHMRPINDINPRLVDAREEQARYRADCEISDAFLAGWNAACDSNNGHTGKTFEAALEAYCADLPPTSQDALEILCSVLNEGHAEQIRRNGLEGRLVEGSAVLAAIDKARLAALTPAPAAPTKCVRSWDASSGLYVCKTFDPPPPEPRS